MANQLTNPPKDSDPLHGEFGQPQVQDLLTRSQRAVAFYVAKRNADLNLRAPQAQFDPATKRRFFETAPTPLRRLFASPLARKGPNADGPHQERRVTSGWGDARSIGYDSDVDANRKHAGLDFRAPTGESVLASADGQVTFVGYQARPRGGVSVQGPHVDAQGNVLDASGTVVAAPSALGHGGVFVQVRHSGDFQNYWTEYMHLSEVSVAQGDRVSEGQVIGKVGTTGGNRGITSGPHLHWQVRYLGTIVKPDSLVPNYWPGHPADAQGASVASSFSAVTKDGPIPLAAGLAASTAANQLQCLDRAAACENFGGPDLKQQQGAHAGLVARNLGVQVSALYDAVAKFQGSLPVVQAPMTFNFDTGLWSDGSPV